MVSGKIDDHITVEFEPGIQPDAEFYFADFCQSSDQRLVTVKRIKPVIDIAVFMWSIITMSVRTRRLMAE